MHYPIRTLPGVLVASFLLVAISGCTTTPSPPLASDALAEMEPVAEVDAPSNPSEPALEVLTEAAYSEEDTEVSATLIEEPEVEAPAADQGVPCYLTLEFAATEFSATLIRMGVDDVNIDVMAAEEQVTRQYPEGTHLVSVWHGHGAYSIRDKGTIEVELKPFTHTKVMAEIIRIYPKLLLNLHILENGQLVKTTRAEF